MARKRPSKTKLYATLAAELHAAWERPAPADDPSDERHRAAGQRQYGAATVPGRARPEQHGGHPMSDLRALLREHLTGVAYSVRARDGHLPDSPEEFAALASGAALDALEAGVLLLNAANGLHPDDPRMDLPDEGDNERWRLPHGPEGDAS